MARTGGALHLQSPDGFAAALTAKCIYLAGFTGEPTAVIEALARHPISGADARVVGVAIPGVNRRDLAALVPDGHVETAFVTPALRDAFAAHRVDFRPMHYSALYRDLLQRRDIELAIVRVSPPRKGRVSLGLAHDFTPALVAAGVPLVGMIEPSTPYVVNGCTLPLERFSALIDGPSPLITLPPDPPRPELERIAQHTASLIRDGDTIQTGLGSAPNAVLRALTSHRGLNLHGGMVSDAALALFDAGALVRATAGAAVCSQAWADRLATDDRVQFRPVDQTHGAVALSRVPRLMAINSALEVDLFGQVNGELLAGRQISGHGGLADFVRGARLSDGGRAIICLSATGDRGRVSRIVDRFDPGTPVAVTRGDVDMVVTEYGVADVRDTAIDVRAARLIAIAAPAHRDRLADAWAAHRRSM